MSKRIKWTREEDDKLQRLVSEGHTWIDISRQFGERSLDQLKTHNDVLVHRCTRDASTKTKFTEDEDWMLLQGVASHGAEWSKIVLTEGLHGIHSRQQLANRWRTLAPLAMQSAGPEDLRGRLKELHAKSGKKSYGTSLGPDMKRRMDFLFSDAATSQSNVTSPTLTDKTEESESSAPGTPPSPAVYPYEVLRLTSKRSRSRSSSVPVAEPILPPELSQLFDIPAIQEAFKNPQTSASAHSVPNPNNATAFRAAWSNVGPFLGITATSGMVWNSMMEGTSPRCLWKMAAFPIAMTSLTNLANWHSYWSLEATTNVRQYVGGFLKAIVARMPQGGADELEAAF